MSVSKRNGVYFVNAAKLDGVSLATIAKINGQVLARSYVSVYPSAHSDTYVKATSIYGEDYRPHLATDPAKSLTGAISWNSWLAQSGLNTNQRFHEDLGSGYVVKRIKYANFHNGGVWPEAGVKNFTFWGSNEASAFAELTYATDTNWTQITCAQSTFDQHTAVDEADLKYILVTNSTSYRYYGFKFADNYWGGGGPALIGMRRIELQVIG